MKKNFRIVKPWPELLQVNCKITIYREALETADYEAGEMRISRDEFVSRAVDHYLKHRALIADFDELLQVVDHELSKTALQAERLPCLHSARRRSHLRRNRK